MNALLKTAKGAACRAPTTAWFTRPAKRSRFRRCAIALLCASLSLSAASPNVFAQVQTPAPAETSAKPAATPAPAPRPKLDQKIITGTIKGQVVSDDGRPLTNATIMARAITGAPSTKMSRVDLEGKFVLEELPAALYIVMASAPGYVDPTLTSSDLSRWPRHLIDTQLKITLVKGGVITGVITDSNGEPVVGVPVHATLADAPTPMANMLSGGSASESDDRGIYRLYGLLPGQYTVAAGSKGQFGQFIANGFDLDVPIYYPSATRDTAVAVSVRSGGETTGIDIRYRSIEGHAISGIVLGNIDTSSPTSATMTMLSPANSNTVAGIALANLVDQRRVFSFYGIADGEYDVFAIFQSSKDNPLIANKRVTVRGADVTGIELKLAPLASIAGTIMLDPIKDEAKCDKRGSQLVETLVDVPRADATKERSQMLSLIFGGVSSTMNAKGEFVLSNLAAGRHRFIIKLPTDSWYVRAIKLPAAAAERGPGSTVASNQRDGSSGSVVLKSGERLSAVTINIGQDAAGLRGSIAPASEEKTLSVGTRLHLVPAEREQADNVFRYGETFVKSDGSFEITNIAPGRYFIFARTDTSNDVNAASVAPVAWDATARVKLRREAETANTVVELKPCQRLVDYSLKLSTGQ